MLTSDRHGDEPPRRLSPETLHRLTDTRTIFGAPPAPPRCRSTGQTVQVAALGATSWVNSAGKGAAASQQPMQKAITGILPEVGVSDSVNQSLGA